MKFAKVMRYDPSLKMVRLLRVEWYTGRYGEGGYATRFSVALRPAIFSFHREHEAWLCTVLGIRLHVQRNYGVAWV